MVTASLAHLVVKVGVTVGENEGGVVSTDDSSLRPPHTAESAFSPAVV